MEKLRHTIPSQLFLLEYKLKNPNKCTVNLFSTKPDTSRPFLGSDNIFQVRKGSVPNHICEMLQ